MKEKPLSGLRVGLFGKGGAGKSTVTVFMARALQERGYSVLVLDADSTNLGLAAALGLAREPAPLLEYFGGMVFSGGAVSCPVDDPRPLVGASVWADTLPARYLGRTGEGIHVMVAGKLGGLGPGAGCDGPVAKIARDVRVSGHGQDPLVLVDYKAGFEDAARGALTSVDFALAVVDPTTAALAMASQLGAMVSAMQSGVPPATQHLERADLVELAVRLFREAPVRGARSVLNRIPSKDTERYLRSVLEKSAAPVLGAFDEVGQVAGQWLRGQRLQSDRLTGSAQVLAAELEEVVSRTPSPVPV